MALFVCGDQGQFTKIKTSEIFTLHVLTCNRKTVL